MKTQINLPQNYTDINEEEKMQLDGGKWSYGGKSWNDSPLYAFKTTRAEYDKWGSILNKLLTIVNLGVSFTGPIGMGISTAFSLGTILQKDSSNKDWQYAIQYCFQDGLHSNMYFTAYVKLQSSNYMMISYSDPWIYTN